MHKYSVGDKVRIKGKDSIRYPDLWVSPDMDHTIGEIGVIINDGFSRPNMPDKSYHPSRSYYVEIEGEPSYWLYGETEIEIESIYFSHCFSSVVGTTVPIVNFSEIIKNNIANVVEVDSFIKV